MIKRVVFDKTTGNIVKFLPTSSTVETVTDSRRNYYFDVTKKETNINQITNFKSVLAAVLTVEIDTKTDSIIENDFTYNGVGFNLTLDNQFDYTMDAQNAASLTYPYTVRCKTGDYQIQSAEEYVAYIQAGMIFKKTKLAEGWALKNALLNKTELEMVNWTETR